jgi:hypothetical protein
VSIEENQRGRRNVLAFTWPRAVAVIVAGVALVALYGALDIATSGTGIVKRLLVNLSLFGVSASIGAVIRRGWRRRHTQQSSTATNHAEADRERPTGTA